MAFKMADRVLETTTSWGTGTIDLNGAEAGFQSFIDGIGDGVETYYAIVAPNGQWETGSGTVTVGTGGNPNRLSRDTVIDGSSGEGVLVNFANIAAAKDVFCDVPASKLTLIDPAGSLEVTGLISSGPVEFDSTVKINGLTYTFPTTQAANRYLKTDGSGNLTWASTLETLNLADLLNVTTTSEALGDLLYRASSVWQNLAGNTTTTKKFLSQTGTGSASAAPSWAQVLAADVVAGTFSGSFTFTGAITNGVLAIPAGIAALGGVYANRNFLSSTADTNDGTARGGGVLSLAYGKAAVFTGVTHNGVPNAPTTVTSAISLMLLDAMGYDGTGYAVGARISASPTESWTTSAHGSKLQFSTTSNTTTTLNTVLTLDQDKSATFAGHILAGTTNTLDLGASATTFRNLFLGGTITSTQSTSTKALTLQNTAGVLIGGVSSTLGVTLGTHTSGAYPTLGYNFYYNSNTFKYLANDIAWVLDFGQASGHFTIRSAPSGSAAGSTITWTTLFELSTTAATSSVPLVVSGGTSTFSNGAGLRAVSVLGGSILAFFDSSAVEGGRIQANGSGAMGFGVATSWSFSGHVLATTDNASDIGSAGANRFRDLTLTRHITFGSAGNLSGGTATFSGRNWSASATKLALGHEVDTGEIWSYGHNAATGGIVQFSSRTSDGSNFDTILTVGGVGGVTGSAMSLGSTAISSSGVTRGIEIDMRAPSTTTTIYENLWLRGGTVAAAFTLATFANVHILDATKGAGSTITTQYGILIDSLSAGSTNYAVYVNGANESQFASIKANTDNAFDIGAIAANRFRDFFLSRNATIGGTLRVNGTVGYGSAPVSNVLLQYTTGVTASSGTAWGQQFTNAITAAANGDLLYGVQYSTVWAKSTFTGLQAFGIRLTPATTGSGTIDTAYGLFIDPMPTATNKWAIYVNSPDQVYLGSGTVGIGNLPAVNVGIYNRVTTNQSGSNYAYLSQSAFTAQANSDSLFSVYLAETFAKNGKTGLTYYGIKLDAAASGSGTIDNAFGLYIGTLPTATAQWAIYVPGGQSSLFGEIIAATDATYDFGRSGAFRFRDMFLSRNIVAGGTTHVLGAGGGNLVVQIGPNSPSADSEARLIFQSSNAANNWTIGSNTSTGGSGVLALLASSVAGGTSYTNVVAKFAPTGDLTVSGVTTALGGVFEAQASAAADFRWYVTGGPTNNKRARFIHTSTNTIEFRLVNDAFNSESAVITLTRSANLLTSTAINGAVIVNNAFANSIVALQLNGGNLGQQMRWINPASSGRFNWMTGSNLVAGGSTFEWTPSTAADGTTFSTPAMSLTKDGLLSVLGVVTSAGGLFVASEAIKLQASAGAGSGATYLTFYNGAAANRRGYVGFADGTAATDPLWIATDGNAPIKFATNSSLRGQVLGDGSFVWGSDPGGSALARFGGVVTASGFNNLSGSTGSISSGAATTIFTAAGIIGVYKVVAAINSSGNVGLYSAVSDVVFDGTNARLANTSNGGGMTITLSGNAVQVTQSTGASATVLYRVHCITA